MKSRDELVAAIAAIDSAMGVAASTAANGREHWALWQAALDRAPPESEVPGELFDWYRSQLFDAGQRAFNHPRLRERWAAGEYDAGPQRHESLGKAGGPNEAYRDHIIGVMMSRQAVGDAWTGYYTIASTSAPTAYLARRSFEDLSTANFGDDAYALIVEAAKREIDSLVSEAAGS